MLIETMGDQLRSDEKGPGILQFGENPSTQEWQVQSPGQDTAPCPYCFVDFRLSKINVVLF